MSFASSKLNKENFKYTTAEVSKRQSLLTAARKNDKVSMKSQKGKSGDSQSSSKREGSIKANSLSKSISKSSVSKPMVKKNISNSELSSVYGTQECPSDFQILKSMFENLNKTRLKESQRITDFGSTFSPRQSHEKQYYCAHLDCVLAANSHLSANQTSLSATNQGSDKERSEANMIYQCFLNFMEEYLLKILETHRAKILEVSNNGDHQKQSCLQSCRSQKKNALSTTSESSDAQVPRTDSLKQSRLKDEQIEKLRSEINTIKDKLQIFEAQQAQLQVLTLSNPAITQLFTDDPKNSESSQSKHFADSLLGSSQISDGKSQFSGSQFSAIGTQKQATTINRKGKESQSSEASVITPTRRNDSMQESAASSDEPLSAEETLERIREVIMKSFKGRPRNLKKVKQTVSEISCRFYEECDQESACVSQLSRVPSESHFPILEEPSSSLTNRNQISINESSSRHVGYFEEHDSSTVRSSEMNFSPKQESAVLGDKLEIMNRLSAARNNILPKRIEQNNSQSNERSSFRKNKQNKFERSKFKGSQAVAKSQLVRTQGQSFQSMRGSQSHFSYSKLKQEAKYQRSIYEMLSEN